MIWNVTFTVYHVFIYWSVHSWSLLFFWYMCLHLCHYHTVLIAVVSSKFLLYHRGNPFHRSFSTVLVMSWFVNWHVVPWFLIRFFSFFLHRKYFVVHIFNPVGVYFINIVCKTLYVECIWDLMSSKFWTIPLRNMAYVYIYIVLFIFF